MTLHLGNVLTGNEVGTVCINFMLYPQSNGEESFGFFTIPLQGDLSSRETRQAWVK